MPFRIFTMICTTVCLLASLLGCSPAQRAPLFDGAHAYHWLKAQVELGPRYPGSPGHLAAYNLITSEVKKYASKCYTQEFEVWVNNKRTKLTLRNIIAVFNPQAEDYVLLAAHWDTRPTADCEVTAESRKQPIPGANDGASGVAVLLELARIFHQNRPDIGVLMVFFDGEDYGPTESDMFWGSRYFAKNWSERIPVAHRPIRIRYGILLDMVGDKNLTIYQEGHSVKAAPEIVEKVWSAASELGYGKYFPKQEKYTIQDDHVFLINAGIKCIDIIDFDYAPWHTLQDTQDKCSAQSLAIVGRIVERVIYSEKM